MAAENFGLFLLKNLMKKLLDMWLGYKILVLRALTNERACVGYPGSGLITDRRKAPPPSRASAVVVPPCAAGRERWVKGGATEDREVQNRRTPKWLYRFYRIR